MASYRNVKEFTRSNKSHFLLWNSFPPFLYVIIIFLFTIDTYKLTNHIDQVTFFYLNVCKYLFIFIKLRYFSFFPYWNLWNFEWSKENALILKHNIISISSYNFLRSRCKLTLLHACLVMHQLPKSIQHTVCGYRK